jgi:hypothetical protein
MKKIRQILKEETSDPFAGVPNDILFDLLQDFEGEYNESKAKQFCKYLSISDTNENTSFFDELINLNPRVSNPNEIIKPTRKEYKVVFEVKEKLWVRYETITNTFGYNEKSVEQQVHDGDIGCFDGPERPNSREVYDSELLDENAYIMDENDFESF